MAYQINGSTILDTGRQLTLTGNVTFASNSHIPLPTGTSGTFQIGMVRFNTVDFRLERYNGSSWIFA